MNPLEGTPCVQVYAKNGNGDHVPMTLPCKLTGGTSGGACEVKIGDTTRWVSYHALVYWSGAPIGERTIRKAAQWAKCPPENWASKYHFFATASGPLIDYPLTDLQRDFCVFVRDELGMGKHLDCAFTLTKGDKHPRPMVFLTSMKALHKLTAEFPRARVRAAHEGDAGMQVWLDSENTTK
jgi:hypothetical protein